MRLTKFFYWLVTALLILVMGVTAIFDLMMIAPIVQNFNRLGYPVYLLPFFGILKLLSVATLLVPWLKRLREGTYAGMLFYAIGAVYSHLVVGDPLGEALSSVVMLLLVIGSYLLRLKLDASAETKRFEKTRLT